MRREGVFILRYRAFDIYSNVPDSPHKPVLAELYGGPFKVYSTREFPGLEPSTELTRVRPTHWPPYLHRPAHEPLADTVEIRCTGHAARRRAQVEKAQQGRRRVGRRVANHGRHPAEQLVRAFIYLRLWRSPFSLLPAVRVYYSIGACLRYFAGLQLDT